MPPTQAYIQIGAHEQNEITLVNKDCCISHCVESIQRLSETTLPPAGTHYTDSM